MQWSWHHTQSQSKSSYWRRRIWIRWRSPVFTPSIITHSMMNLTKQSKWANKGYNKCSKMLRRNWSLWCFATTHGATSVWQDFTLFGEKMKNAGNLILLQFHHISLFALKLFENYTSFCLWLKSYFLESGWWNQKMSSRGQQNGNCYTLIIWRNHNGSKTCTRLFTLHKHETVYNIYCSM